MSEEEKLKLKKIQPATKPVLEKVKINPQATSSPVEKFVDNFLIKLNDVLESFQQKIQTKIAQSPAVAPAEKAVEPAKPVVVVVTLKERLTNLQTKAKAIIQEKFSPLQTKVKALWQEKGLPLKQKLTNKEFLQAKVKSLADHAKQKIAEKLSKPK